MALQEKVMGRSQILEMVESAAQVAVQTYGLKIWGLDIVGGVGASTRPVVRVFVDTPWEGKQIPFIMPETRAQKSKKKAVHPKHKKVHAHKNANEEEILIKELQNRANESPLEDAPLVDIINDEDGADISTYNNRVLLDNADSALVNESESMSAESVDINQCAHISRMIGIALEVEDTFADAWVLEVSSPGLERQFYEVSQLSTYILHPIDVTLVDAHKYFENRRKFRGVLKSVEDTAFTLLLDTPKDTECSFLWEEVKKAHLVHIFPD